VSYRRWLLAFCLLAVPLPAFANNPPQPDGALSVLLIFPVAILGLRLAGVRRDEQKKTRRLLTGLILGFAFLLTLAGTGIAIIPLLVLLCYGLHRGGLAISRGQGTKRFAAGAGVILFTFFAIANYLASLNPLSVGRYESSAVGTVRTINTAEITFQSDAMLDTNKNGVGEYGTLEQLEKTGFIEAGFLSRAEQRGYRVTLAITGDPAQNEKQFFVSAVPLNYGQPRRTLSLLAAWQSKHPFARRSFASDESGVIRGRDLGGTRPVTREETQKWEPIN